LGLACTSCGGVEGGEGFLWQEQVSGVIESSGRETEKRSTAFVSDRRVELEESGAMVHANLLFMSQS
jgi:hypothetical protein